MALAPVINSCQLAASTTSSSCSTSAVHAPGSSARENKNSANHGGHGNYVLRADSSVTWETSPNIGPDHDNIWTLGSGKDRQLVYKGTEVPANAKDVIVCP